jgi:phage shock protein A
VPDGRRAQPAPRLERVGDAEAREHRLERRAEALRRRHEERDLLGRNALAHERQDFLRDELERVARARPLEEADGARR